MLPGKTYRPEDVLRIMRHRIWFILLSFAIISAVTATVARKLPDLYRAETLILVVPQQVPESYVKSTITTRIDDRLQSLSQQILSRTRLERIIQDNNLYVDERRDGIMEDVVEQMRKDIKVDVVKGDAFKVSYVGRDPRVVMKVTDRLASLFIEESLRDRATLAEGTDQFLEAQLEDAKRRLMEHEKKLEDYRKRFAGQLPSQLESNLTLIQNTEVQIQQLNESLNRDRDRRLIVQRMLADVSVTPGPASAPTVDADGNAAGATAAQQLVLATAALHAMELHLKPDHPDIKRAKRMIRELEKKAEAEALEAPVTPESAPRRVSPAEAARQGKIKDLQGELDQIDRQTAYKQSEEKRLRGVVAGYQQRVEAAPTRESEMTELTRDYATLQSMYTSLLAKKEDSKISTNLERRQIGEQFKLLDSARLPEKPFSPDRKMINVTGMAGGLGFGLALIALLEYRDATFKTDDEVVSVLSLPVLAVVPLMQSEKERRKARRVRLLLGMGMGAAVVACLSVLAWTFVR